MSRSSRRHLYDTTMSRSSKRHLYEVCTIPNYLTRIYEPVTLIFTQRYKIYGLKHRATFTLGLAGAETKNMLAVQTIYDIGRFVKGDQTVEVLCFAL